MMLVVQGRSCCVPPCYMPNQNLPQERCSCCVYEDDGYDDINVTIDNGIFILGVIAILIFVFKSKISPFIK